VYICYSIARHAKYHQLDTPVTLLSCPQAEACDCRVVLERLSPRVEDMLAEHNAEALDNFLAYIRDYVLTNFAVLPPGNMLPLSGVSYPASHVPHAPGPPNYTTRAGGALQEYCKAVVISSPFVALSGMTSAAAASQACP